MKSLLSAWFAALLLLSTSLPAAAAIWLDEYPPGTLSATPAALPADWAMVPQVAALPIEPLAEDIPAIHRAVLPLKPPPVPEPLLVVMLACGMLLIMPGGWLVEWSHLGDRRRLLGASGP